ncbi:hypothetical protein Ga0123461_2256 [Mariprofundus aestuarium]|uniref:Uncharacterized protein n=1 Tax=Mariprofundus aestuarium TaxID=1921086 RepID=A0A2K8L497_MARES|nr:hypothetical protein [Mariprofundus aestuarium]ATX80661.1 hypothetical protein Ga0123461_2256 [Mariprofundus aestuarium]
MKESAIEKRNRLRDKKEFAALEKKLEEAEKSKTKIAQLYVNEGALRLEQTINLKNEKRALEREVDALREKLKPHGAKVIGENRLKNLEGFVAEEIPTSEELADILFHAYEGLDGRNRIAVFGVIEQCPVTFEIDLDDYREELTITPFWSDSDIFRTQDSAKKLVTEAIKIALDKCFMDAFNRPIDCSKLLETPEGRIEYWKFLNETNNRELWNASLKKLEEACESDEEFQKIT